MKQKFCDTERLLMVPQEKDKNILRGIVEWIRDDPQPLRTATPSSFGFSAIWSARSTRTIYRHVQLGHVCPTEIARGPYTWHARYTTT